MTTPPPPIPERTADAQRITLPAAEGRPARHLLECLHCLRADPDAEAGYLAAHPDLDEARRRLRNHLAQHHDLFPSITRGS